MGRTAFLFPGQGAQVVGMGCELIRDRAEARDLFARANDLLGFDLTAICLDGPPEALNATDVSQPAIFVASLAALEDLKATRPEVVAACEGAAGLSLGEYTALTFAGALDFEAGLKIVRLRGQAMQEAALASPSGMTSVIGLDEAAIDQLCQRLAPYGRLWKANLLGHGNIVVSGENAALEHLEPIAAELGASRCVPLTVAGAFHTPLMKPADQRLAAALAEIELRPPRLPVYSNVDARVHTDPDEIRDLLVRQVIAPVRWEESMNAMIADGFDSFIEIGPGRVLAGLLKRIHRKIPCENIPAR
ncbi:(Acyl-carrier-protein) S-malonyltransferase [Isosphaera pallida ATCC 43644]|uniref:Malonyl CoA-acyl carrier protein transacylase n=1 Tax=Isosphaera pallida (strain ATCC 43644 / DSM 9630 / IS1B) TaxID=575540 RepID=E8QYR9_ISOPI|nr:ACP S-malonyltransferase [Isosphaera pallida]ADV61045.1 (Acyl-carrier-protein) S-malonyltransferase [Isosphaera pallida ATCC 43644]